MDLNIRDYIHAKYASSARLWETTIFDFIKIEGNNKILDVGCGNADYWKRNYVSLPTGVQLTLLDKYDTVSKELIEKPNVNFVCSDLHDMNYTKEFDIVLAKDVLYLLEDFDTCMYTITKALNTKGVFYGTCYSIKHMEEVYRILNNIGVTSGHHHQYRLFNFENLKDNLEKYFSSINVCPQEDTLKIKSINDAMLFIMSYLSEGYQTPFARQNLWDYLRELFHQQGELIVNRKMYIFAAKDCVL